MQNQNPQLFSIVAQFLSTNGMNKTLKSFKNETSIQIVKKKFLYP